MAFSALLSCETPTTAFRIRMVRIWSWVNRGQLRVEVRERVME